MKDLIKSEFNALRTEQANQLVNIKDDLKKEVRGIQKALPGITEMKNSIKKVQSFKVQMKPYQTEVMYRFISFTNDQIGTFKKAY